MIELEASLLADMLRHSLAQGLTPGLTIVSNSMAPLLRRGDQVYIEAISPAQLSPGDIITVVAHSQLLTHRFWQSVTGKGELQLVTRGDRPLTFDPPWPATDLVGRVIARRRQGRALWLKTGSGGWLNRHLAWLAAAEQHRLAQYQKLQIRSRPWHWQQWLRLVIYLWAALLTGLVQVIARFSSNAFSAVEALPQGEV